MGMRFSAPPILAFCWVLSLPLGVSEAQSDPLKQFIGRRLISLSASKGGNPVDCGSTTLDRPDLKTTACAKVAFQSHKPFHILYSRGVGSFQSAYGMAGDASGNVYAVEYDAKGLLHLGLGKRSQVFDGNRVRVTSCIKPVRIASTRGGILACIIPVNEQESKLAAQQEEPIDTTVCAILEHPSAFNNKMVRVRGYVSGNFEYSGLGADGCTASLWFAYGNGGGPPDLLAFVPGGARAGSEDAEGRRILPVPVKLVEDANFQRFQELMVARAKADERDMQAGGETWTEHRVTATFTGRIDAVSDDVHAFHLQRKGVHHTDFLGFGHMGEFDAQFVLQSVGNDAVLEDFPPIPNPTPSNPPTPK